MSAARAALLLVALVACKSPAEASPRLQFDGATHDFGNVGLGDELAATFPLRNAGTAPLQLRGAVPVLGCKALAVPQQLAPGERGELRVHCRPQATGPLSVSLRIDSNDPNAPEIALLGNVAPHLGFERPFLSVRVPFGEEHSEEIALIGDRLGQAKPVLGNAALPGCESALVEDGGWRLRVHCRGARVGLASEVLELRTGLADPALLTLPASLEVIGTLRISPTNPYFNVRLPGPKTVVVDVQSARADFRVSRVEVREGPFVASLREGSERGRYEAVVTLDETRWNDAERGANGVLRINSNDASEPEKDVPLSAFGKRLEH